MAIWMNGSGDMVVYEMPSTNINNCNNQLVPTQKVAGVPIPEEAPTKSKLAFLSMKETPKKEAKMARYYDTELSRYIDNSMGLTELQEQRVYLYARVDSISMQKNLELEIKFGLRDDEMPKTFDETLARLTAGKYFFADEKKRNSRYWNDYIRWRDPAVKEDMKGFQAASDAFEKAKTAARDTIAISTAASGLAATQALETWTYAAS